MQFAVCAKGLALVCAKGLAVDSLAQNIPRYSRAASEGYSGNGTNIIPSSHAAGSHFAGGRIFYLFVTYLSGW